MTAKKTLSVSEVENLIHDAEESFPHQACGSCECYLGYLAQLGMQVEERGKEMIREHIPPRSEMHACLGCDPCPPADRYADFLRNMRRA